MRRTMNKLLRTRRPPRELFLARGRIKSTSAQYVPVLSKKIRMEDNVLPTLPRQGGDQLLPCLHKAARWLLTTPPKNRVDGAGRQRRTSASSTHSCGPVPLLYEDYVH
jgi:hypothetical protein